MSSRGWNQNAATRSWPTWSPQWPQRKNRGQKQDKAKQEGAKPKPDLPLSYSAVQLEAQATSGEDQGAQAFMTAFMTMMQDNDAKIPDALKAFMPDPERESMKLQQKRLNKLRSLKQKIQNKEKAISRDEAQWHRWILDVKEAIQTQKQQHEENQDKLQRELQELRDEEFALKQQQEKEEDTFMDEDDAKDEEVETFFAQLQANNRKTSATPAVDQVATEEVVQDKLKAMQDKLQADFHAKMMQARGELETQYQLRLQHELAQRSVQVDDEVEILKVMPGVGQVLPEALPEGEGYGAAKASLAQNQGRGVTVSCPQHGSEELGAEAAEESWEDAWWVTPLWRRCDISRCQIQSNEVCLEDFGVINFDQRDIDVEGNTHDEDRDVADSTVEFTVSSSSSTGMRWRLFCWLVVGDISVFILTFLLLLWKQARREKQFIRIGRQRCSKPIRRPPQTKQVRKFVLWLLYLQGMHPGLGEILRSAGAGQSALKESGAPGNAEEAPWDSLISFARQDFPSSLEEQDVVSFMGSSTTENRDPTVGVGEPTSIASMPEVVQQDSDVEMDEEPSDSGQEDESEASNPMMDEEVISQSEQSAQGEHRDDTRDGDGPRTSSSG